MTADQIKQWQAQAELTQAQAAKRIGVPLRTYARWLTGKAISQLGLALLERARIDDDSVKACKAAGEQAATSNN